MKSFETKLFFLVLVVLIGGCIMDYSNSMLRVYNASNEKITILYSNNENPHTPNNIAYYISENQIINPHDTSTIYINGKRDAWHNYIMRGTRKKLFIYFFSVEKLTGYNGIYTMDELCSIKEYLKVKEYSEQELVKNNWIIDFK